MEEDVEEVKRMKKLSNLTICFQHHTFLHIKLHCSIFILSYNFIYYIYIYIAL